MKAIETSLPKTTMSEFDNINITNIIRFFKLAANGCWEWQRSCATTGYGQVIIHGKNWRVHKLMYLFHKGDLPLKHVVRHTCHNRKCGNPNHLVSGTVKDNWHDSAVVHRAAAANRRKVWFIKGIKYITVREASKLTGLHQGTIIKYTIDGVFDYEAYLVGCKWAHQTPRI